MKSIITLLAVAVILINAPALASDSVPNTAADIYVTAISKHFTVPVDSLKAMMELGVTAEELPALCKLAAASKSAPTQMARLRSQGDSWPEIMNMRKVPPGVFYMIVSGKIDSRIYAPIFEKFKTIPESEWNSIDWTDEEITNLTNLKFLASYHDYSPFEIMAARDVGKDFVKINGMVAQIKIDMDKKAKQEALKKSKQAKEEDGK